MTKENPVSIRSKKYLINSLLKLINQKPYHKISIKEITEKAELSRMTFYTNFKTKEDILKYYVDLLVDEYYERLDKYETLSPYDFAFEYFQFWLERKDFVIQLKKNNLLILIKLFQKYLYQMNEVFNFNNMNHLDDEVMIQYNLVFTAGGLWNLLDYWAERNFQESPEKMAEIFQVAIVRD